MTGRKRKPKTMVGAWRHSHRMRLLWASLRVFLLLPILVVITLLSRAVPSTALPHVADKLNAYSTLVLMLLTLVTAGATLLYVRLTGLMLHEMVEARRADVRPNLKLSLDPQFRSKSRSDEARLYLDVTATLTNLGKGRAVGIKTKVCIPASADNTGAIGEWMCTEVKWSSPIVDPNEGMRGTAFFFMPSYDVPQRVNDFLELEAEYEDLHQGLYCMRHIFDLHNYSYGLGEPKFSLSSTYEALYYSPFEERNRYLSDRLDRRKPMYEHGDVRV